MPAFPCVSLMLQFSMFVQKSWFDSGHTAFPALPILRILPFFANSGAQPTVPPAPPAASYGARGYGTQPSLRSGRRPAPASGSDTSAIKVVGWVLIIIIIFLIRILTG